MLSASSTAPARAKINATSRLLFDRAETACSAACLARTGSPGTNQVGHLRQLARQHRASFTREIVQCETMIDSLNLLDGDIQRGKLFGTEGYIADKYFACLRKLHVFPGRKPRERQIQ